MAIRGQRFTLDPDSDNFTFNLHEQVSEDSAEDGSAFVKEIREREPTGPPPPPKFKQTKTGFPQPRTRLNTSNPKPRQQRQEPRNLNLPDPLQQPEPSDRAIISQISRKFGIDPESKAKQEISDENKRRIAQMSVDDIEEARSEIMSNFSPAFLERFLKRANIEEAQRDEGWIESDGPDPIGKENEAEKEVMAQEPISTDQIYKGVASNEEVPKATHLQSPRKSSDDIEAQFREAIPSIHFPIPPRKAEDYVPLDPNSPSFLSDLKKHYFPELPNDPSTMAWLQDPTDEESQSSPYAPTQSRYAPSDIRFDFAGRLLAPNESREIPVSKGLHHHGEAPESAGYTVPELSILARSMLPNQRCIAYQVLGRILYRLGRGDFGPRGSDLQEGLWATIEKERPLEIMMGEANRTGGHVSAKAYATEALWLWRKGGGGDRGILKAGERIAK